MERLESVRCYSCSRATYDPITGDLHVSTLVCCSCFYAQVDFAIRRSSIGYAPTVAGQRVVKCANCLVPFAPERILSPTIIVLTDLARRR